MGADSSEVVGDQSQPITLLHSQLADLPEHRDALRPRGENSQERDLVDESGNLSRRHLGRVERAGPDYQIADRLAKMGCSVLDLNVATHAAERVQKTDPGGVHPNSRDL